MSPKLDDRQDEKSLIGDRLREEREESGFTREYMAALGGVSAKTQGKYERGESPPDALYLTAVAATVDIQYIVTGERSRSSQSQRSILDANGQPASQKAWLERFVVVERYGAEASAGHGAIPDDEAILEYMAFQRQWLRAIGVQPNQAVVVTARGDSMEPLISSGDLVIVDLSRTELTDGVFVLRRDEHLVIKRVQDLLDGRWMLKSENDAYDPIVIEPEQVEDLRIVGRARYTWAGRRL